MLNLAKIKEFVKQNPFEVLVFGIFCLITIFVSFFHECWFDELQAWGVAKDNLYDILFVTPHYEGHPPVWALILKFFQFFTSNPELVLKIPNMLLMFTAVYLLIFKSPFPKIIRYTLPFTYFIIYQYTIVSRPYSLFTLGLFMAATFYKERDTKPFKFAGSLAILSFSCLYGMILTAFICIEWGLNILIQQKTKIKTFLSKDKRFFSMLGLFFICLILCFIVVPRESSYMSRLTNLPIWQKITYFSVGLPADATAFNVFNYHTAPRPSLLSLYSLIAWGFGIFLMLQLLRIFKMNGKLTMFSLVYVPLVVFMAKCYIHPHHIGLIWIVFIYLFWCLMSDRNIQEVKFTKNFKYYLLFIFLIQIYWAGFSLITEITWNYSPTRIISSWLKENNIETVKPSPLMSLFDNRQKDDGGFGDYKIMNDYSVRFPHKSWVASIINPYFNKNIFYTFNVDKPTRCYFLNKVVSERDAMMTYMKWIKLGSPDIFITEAPYEKSRLQYFKPMALVKRTYSGWIFKDRISVFTHDIYAEKKKMLPILIQNSNDRIQNETN